MKRVICLILGVICFALGCVGLMLPIIPQIPFFLMSVILFAEASTWFRKKVSKSKLYNQAIAYIDKIRNKKL